MEMIKEAGAMFLEASGATILGSSCESFLESLEKNWMLDEPVLDRVRSVVENFELYVPKMEKHMGDRHQAELLEELKEGMTRGRTLLNKLEASELGWFKARYNDQLIQLEASLKSMIRKLRLQSALDVKEALVLEKENAEVVKEALVLEKENAEVVKSTKRKVDEVDETVKELGATVKAGFLDSKRRDEMLHKRLRIIELQAVGDRVGELDEGAALLAKLGELDDLAADAFLSPWLQQLITDTRQRTEKIFGVVEKTTAENKAIHYMGSGEMKYFRMSIEDGVNLLRKCPTILEWTDELKSEYTNKFRALNQTLEALHNRLAGIRSLKWRCGKCDDKSLGAASTSFGDSAGFAIQGN